MLYSTALTNTRTVIKIWNLPFFLLETQFFTILCYNKRMSRRAVEQIVFYAFSDKITIDFSTPNTLLQGEGSETFKCNADPSIAMEYDPTKRRKLCIDFDGVLAEYHGVYRGE